MRRRSRLPSPRPAFALIATACCLLLAATATGQQWSRAFGPMGLDGPSGFDGEAHVLVGDGDWLYAGGWIGNAGGEPAPYIARWNGQRWEPLGDGIMGPPDFILPLSEGVLVGGGLVPGVRYWDGTWWDRNEGLTREPLCAALHVGRQYIGNMFYTGDMVTPVVPFLRWDDAHGWEFLPNCGGFDMEQEVRAMAHYGERLHLGGIFFHMAPGDTTWNHVAWSAGEGIVGFGTGVYPGRVDCLEPGDGGLWIGGGFLEADGQTSHGLVFFSGETYFPVARPSDPRAVRNMTMFQGMLFTVQDEGIDGTPAWVVRRYDMADATPWSPPLGGVFSDELFDIGVLAGDELYVGGAFPNGIVRWDGDEWVHLGGGIGTTFHDRHWFNALVRFEGDVVAAGDNLQLPSVLRDQPHCRNVVRWDGRAWHRLGDGLAEEVEALAVRDGALYAATRFAVDGHRIHRWDGVNWLGAGAADGQVTALAVHDGELVVAGYFASVDGVASPWIAAFDGTAWHPLGSDGPDGPVLCLHSADGRLYAGGSFTSVGGQPAGRVARWDGTAWSAVGSGVDGGSVLALTTFHGDLVAGGGFTATGDDTPAARVARWDGTTWHPLGEGIGGDLLYGVLALRGTADLLIVGGDFSLAGGAPAGGLAAWDGTGWAPFGGGVSGGYNLHPTVSALLVVDGDLVAGGNFAQAGDVPSYCLAWWEDGTLVPNLLADLRATASYRAGRPCVELAWRTSRPAAADAFRVWGRAGGWRWPVTVTATGPDAFRAVDRRPFPAGTDGTVYTLEHRSADGEWRRLATRGVAPPRTAVSLAASPNPCNPGTRVAFTVDRPGPVHLAVYDVTGRRVAVLVDAELPAGDHDVRWEGRDDSGRPVAAGTYLVRLRTVVGSGSAKVGVVR